MPSGPRAVPASVNGWNADFLDDAYARYKENPESVSADLRAFFQGFELGLSGPTAGGGAGGGGEVSDAQSDFHAKVDDLVFAYRDMGHLAAKLDPFGRPSEPVACLKLEEHGLTEADLSRQVNAARLGMEGPLTLGEVIERLERTYCSSIGPEIMHVPDRAERAWLVERCERHGGAVQFDNGRRVHILRQLLQAEMFEKFLGRRYPGDKRFSLEGSESLIPLLNGVLEHFSENGVEEVVIGMAHRGRLNVLNNVLGKSYEQIFTEFEDTWQDDYNQGGGDVKYHRGYSGERRFPNGRSLHVALSSNPSHLEAVGPVVQGRTRAKQRQRGDKQRLRVAPVVIHGDAAVIGQGVVAETLNFSQLEGYTTGGTVHLVVNNLIGFTTSPRDGRSSRYCTDVGKIVGTPVLHVNGEDPEACVMAALIAVEYRQTFKKDIFIDLHCYRRYGHNEQDEASFTQPLLYEMIKKKPSVLTSYARRLLEEGVISDDDMDQIRKQLDLALEKAQESARKSPYDPTIDPGSARWVGMTHKYSFEEKSTAVAMDTIREVCQALGTVPEGFHVHRKLKGLLEHRRQLPETGQISYADAESLAYGTLLLEGVPVRLSGQDSRRGTFSHRHAVLVDSRTAQTYTPLNHMRALGEPGTAIEPLQPGPDGRLAQAKFCVYDSPLSEFSVMGFEYGYALTDPNMLVLWEAQFGDFVNGAQVIIDQFLASAEQKWDRWCGLVLLLPHGYEGQGPEHSSARMERFLELCADENMEVCYPSTAAQAFHMFRRQVRRPYRKPLVVMTPKSLIRTPTSHIEELTRGRFMEILDDPCFLDPAGPKGKDDDKARPAAHDPAQVREVVLCTGKIYWELDERRRALGRQDVALVRVEQLYPLHKAMLAGVLARYDKAQRIVWVQEEPRNMGAYLFMDDAMRRDLRGSLPDGQLHYIGRKASASPATGSKRRHKIEQEQIISQAIGPLDEDDRSQAKDPAGPKLVRQSA
ncbi:MAG: 2-oxoglutarate dehydrogenase subunit E1 [Phycisphaerales bacterium]|nr:MAG: 2-oxoglutarate dehydrogenase subunit E1 [Phycisphaerales bacterium]